MAGYMTILNNNVFVGRMTNGTSGAVKNGQVLVEGATTNVGKLVLPSSADSTTEFQLVEATTIYDGMTAYHFVVKKLANPYYFIETNVETAETLAYDNTEYTTAAGELLRAHPLEVGEEFVTNFIDGTLTVGTCYGVKADGKIGAAA